MPSEEQLLSNGLWALGSQSGFMDKAGQKLTISQRTVSHLSFFLGRLGSPGGTLTYYIRKADGYPGTLIASKLQGNANDIAALTTPPYNTPDGAQWYEVELDTPVFINEEVRIYVDSSAGGSNNFVGAAVQLSDVKASEQGTIRNVGGASSWVAQANKDLAYKYTYVVSDAPTVTTQAVTNISPTTATGNGNITDLGDGSVTQHGVCWNKTGTPDTSDDKTEEGAAGATGAFTSNMTELLPNTLYYVRAYATNEYGTSYGTEVSFTTLGKPYSQAHFIG